MNYLFKPTELKQLNEIIAKINNKSERYYVAASPGSVTNNGKVVPAIEVKIGDIQTQKIRTMIYRDLVSNFSDWLKKQMDRVSSMDALPSLLPEKPKNSL